MAATLLTMRQVEQALAAQGLTPYRMLDNLYWSVDTAFWDLILEGYLDPAVYWTDFDDCDDRALEFKVDVHWQYRVDCGMVVNATHAWNVIVLPDLTLRFVDAGWSEGPAYVQPGLPGSLYDLAGAKVLI